MLSVFCKPRELPGSPLSPVGAKRRLLEHSSLIPEEEEYLQQVLDSLYTSLPGRQHAYVTEHYLGGGANAIAYIESLTQGMASDGDVSVFFKGTLEDKPEELEDAQFILQEYKRCFDVGPGGGGETPVMDVLAQLRGPWAFVVYDRSHGRIVAARDAAGEEPLCWGTTLLSEGVLFSSDKALLEGECADADDFPPGAIYVSEDFSTVGQITSYAADSAAAAAAAQQEALCRVESSSDLRKVPSVGQIEAN